ncbi:hypothetical protein jhhlp_002344 [Lomentospora prolificans]|uniref:Uncharacterized protein n=1 Tax=Lomentospora prolificans TaxID=41688 RepID=A0A2N3NDR3_9PEZI|nr:hypothetical protein jhhlp_002344 [Lomentospora prolificans]
MPLRNYFGRRSGTSLVHGETIHPTDPSIPNCTDGHSNPPAFERVDTVGSKASSILSIKTSRSQDTGEYKMSDRASPPFVAESLDRKPRHQEQRSSPCPPSQLVSARTADPSIVALFGPTVVNDSGIYLPPSPTENSDRSPWSRRHHPSRSSCETSTSNGDIEPFSISRESFDSYRRSFDISAKSPVVNHQIPPRQSLDSARFPRLPRSSLSSRHGTRHLATEEESDGASFEDVGLDEPASQHAPSKRRGLFGMFSEAQEPSPNGPAVSRFLPGKRRRGQSGLVAELGNMERLRSSASYEEREAEQSKPTMSCENKSSAQNGVEGLALASLAIHADDGVSAHRAVAPALHVSTTYRYARNPDELVPMENIDSAAPNDSHIYSRLSSPNITRLETLLTAILRGPSVTYTSGLSAFHAMIVRLNPRRIAIGGGYHGCHGVLNIMRRLTGLEILPLDCPEADLQPGDIIHVETPLNPTGEARNLDFYARKAQAVGAYLTVDATFAPPPLQDPFAHGADIVMHSGTKYFGGHSDLLCGVLAVSPRRAADDGWHAALLDERVYLGSVMGNFEGWLGLRSLRTLELRVERQSANATNLVSWLAAQRADPSTPAARLLDAVLHASLQDEAADERSWLRKQMPRGFGPVFAVRMRDEAVARALPSKLSLFHHATSLGGVESLIEWRAMTDATVDKRLLRISVGVESWEDLRDDLHAGFEALLEEKKEA